MTETISTTKATSFLKTHERLIIIVIVALLTWGLYSKVTSYLVSHDQAVSSRAQATLEAQSDANKQLAATSQQQLIQYQQLAAQLVSNNAALAANQVRRAQVTQRQQTVDA